MQDTREMQVWPLSHEDPLSRKGQPSPELLPGEFHRQRSLAVYNHSSWGCKELDVTEQQCCYQACIHSVCDLKKKVFICLALLGLSWGMQDLVPKPGTEIQSLHWGQGVSAPNHWTNHQGSPCLCLLINKSSRDRGNKMMEESVDMEYMSLPGYLRTKSSRRVILMVLYVCACMHAKSLQLCLTLCNPMDCSQPGSSVHRVLQARILGWVAMPFSRGSSWLRDWNWVSCIAGKFFTVWANREATMVPFKSHQQSQSCTR